MVGGEADLQRGDAAAVAGRRRAARAALDGRERPPVRERDGRAVGDRLAERDEAGDGRAGDVPGRGAGAGGRVGVRDDARRGDLAVEDGEVVDLRRARSRSPALPETADDARVRGAGRDEPVVGEAAREEDGVRAARPRSASRPAAAPARAPDAVGARGRAGRLRSGAGGPRRGGGQQRENDEETERRALEHGHPIMQAAAAGARPASRRPGSPPVLLGQLLAGEPPEPLARVLVRPERLVVRVLRVGGDLLGDGPHLAVRAPSRCSGSRRSASTQVSSSLVRRDVLVEEQLPSSDADADVGERPEGEDPVRRADEPRRSRDPPPGSSGRCRRSARRRAEARFPRRPPRAQDSGQRRRRGQRAAPPRDLRGDERRAAPRRGGAASRRTATRRPARPPCAATAAATPSTSAARHAHVAVARLPPRSDEHGRDDREQRRPGRLVLARGRARRASGRTGSRRRRRTSRRARRR